MRAIYGIIFNYANFVQLFTLAIEIIPFTTRKWFEEAPRANPISFDSFKVYFAENDKFTPLNQSIQY